MLSKHSDTIASGGHTISAEGIHPNVHFICRCLREQGYDALLVGGAVRDLLLGRQPKDYDLATSAPPDAVRRLFRNARLIGRRFRLVLLRYPNMSVEVSTFRREPLDKENGMIHRDNRYGTWREDARRRDFTINALAFDPLAQVLHDPVGGLKDLERGRIRTIKPPRESFTEDPVRMLRAVRFKVRLGFEIDPQCEAAIADKLHLLNDVKRHRLAEEIQRFLTCGQAVPAYREFDRLGLLRPLLGIEAHRWFVSARALRDPLAAMEPLLAELDRWMAAGGEPIAPTVAQLGLLTSLALERYQRYLLGADLQDQPVKVGRSKKQMPRILAEWGMLNGQIAPALAIVDAARVLVRAGGKPLRDPGAADALPGIREALLLLATLRNVRGHSLEFVEKALHNLHRLPDLPILDHPRPANRPPRRRPVARSRSHRPWPRGKPVPTLPRRRPDSRVARHGKRSTGRNTDGK